MNDFIINDFLTLKLEKGKTKIYVKGRLFRQCKFLLLNIPIDKISSFDEIQSIDETEENLDRSLGGNKIRTLEIPPEVEFWGHCSNLQVWVENNYDTRLLQRTLAFPLLKKLSDLGDPIAQKVFEEQIIKRLKSGTQNVREFLIKGGYLEYLGISEIDFIFDNEYLKKLLFDKVLNLYNLEYHIIPLLIMFVVKRSMSALKFLKEIILKKSSDLEFFVFFKKKNLLNYLNKQEYNQITSNELLLKSFNVIIELEKLVKKSLFHSSIEEFMGVLDNLWFSSSHRYCIKDNHIIGLILYQVNLSSFPESITNLENLQYLVLTSNKLKEIPVSISKLKGLKLLKLGKNQLRMLPISIGFLPNLEELNLASNNLNSIPHTIGNLTNLKKLDLSSNNIVSLPNSIGELESLEILTLGIISTIHRRNKVKKLPNSISKLKNLKILNLSNIELRSIPESIGELSLLEELDLEENKLHNVPPSIGRLTSLKRLNLEKNVITELPESIGDLRNLESLRLSNNKIEKIPISLGTLPNLKDISFFNNPVKNVPNSIKNFRILTTEELKFLEDLRKYDEYSAPDIEEYFIKDAIDVSECKKNYYGELSYWGLFENWIIDAEKFFFFHKKHIIGIALLAKCVPNSIKNLTKLKFLEIINLERASNNSKINIHEILNKISHNSNLRYLLLKGSGLEIDPDITKITHNSNLRYLYWKDSLLETIPDLTRFVPKLHHLGIYGHFLKRTPEWLFDFARKHNSRRYKREGVIEEEAEILGLLELISTPFWGYKFDDGKLEIDADGEGGCYAWPTGYRINDLGHVIELNLGYSNTNNNNYYALSYFPEEVCRLTHLERLYVCNGIYSKDDGIIPAAAKKADAQIPSAITNLTKLRQFWSNAKFSNSLLPFLNSLEKFETDVEFYD